MSLKSLLLLVAATRAKVYPTANETYTSILYAPSPASPMHKAWGRKRLELTCIVAAQGLQLAALDPARDRVLLVNEALAAEADTRALLEAAAWKLRVVSFDHHTDPTGRNRTFAFPAWERLDPAAAAAFDRGSSTSKDLLSAETLGRKNQLWALPYERAFFSDADVIFLNTSKIRNSLKQLWRVPRDGKLLATQRGPHEKCFTSALLVFEPNRADFDRLNRYLWDPDVTSLAHCPGHDQRVLNGVFATRWTKVDFHRHGAESKGKRASKRGQTIDAIHFHNKKPSPYVAKLFRSLVAKSPPAVRGRCGHLYKSVLPLPGESPSLN
mmetsp:Transcript_25438/g.76397  ORF Transcript_25438/g.76397 Transcript_25438/m.76397 type:complete len:325 (+) Transcript_25438:179-1153(+)